jgi:hypothetical protein
MSRAERPRFMKPIVWPYDVVFLEIFQFSSADPVRIEEAGVDDPTATT